MTTRLSLRMRCTNRHVSFLVGRVAVTTFLCLVVIGVPSASAATHWVNDDDPNGGGYDPPGSSCLDPGYATIQDAVNAAIPGETIMVCAGNYMENVNLAESLTLLGAQAGVNACGRVGASESFVRPLNPLVMTLELDTGSAGSIIDGFSFVGGTRAIQSDTGPIN